MINSLQKCLYRVELCLLLSLLTSFCGAQSFDQWTQHISKEMVLEDLDSMYKKILSKHINPFWKNTSSEFYNGYKKIRRSIEDHKAPITMGGSFIFFQQLLAYTGNIHDIAYLLGNNPISRYAPIYFKRFSAANGYELRVMVADTALSDILGAKILKIGNYMLDQVIEKIRSILPGQSTHAEYYLCRLALKNTSILHLLGISGDASYCDYTFLDRKGSVISKRIASLDIKTINNNITLAFYDDLLESIPLTRKKRELNYWFEYLPDNKTIYFRYRAVSQNDDESTILFSRRLLHFADSVRAEKLIIDVRDNIGGNSFLNMPIIAGIQNSYIGARPGSLFCIINGMTFSAAINFFQQLDQKAGAILIGEAPADAPNFCSDFILDSLPNSKYRLPLSTICLLNSYEFDKRKNYTPDKVVKDFTWEEYNRNKDRMLQIALEYRPLPENTFRSATLEKATGSYRYTGVKSASIKRQGDRYWFFVPGEIAAILTPVKANAFKGNNSMVFVINPGSITLIHKNNKLILSKLVAGSLTPDEMVASGMLLEALPHFMNEKKKHPLLSLSDANMSLWAYQRYFLTGNKQVSMDLLNISSKLNPGSFFNSYTQTLINNTNGIPDRN